MPGSASSSDSLSSPSPSPEPVPAPSRPHTATTSHSAPPHSSAKGKTQGTTSGSPASSIPEGGLGGKESSGPSRHQRTPSIPNNHPTSTSGRDSLNNTTTSKGRQRSSLPPVENHHQYNSSTASAGLDSDSELSELTDEDQDTAVTSGKVPNSGGRGGRTAGRGGARSKNDRDSDAENAPTGTGSWRTPAAPLPSGSSASTSESPRMPPPTTTRKKRSSIVPAPMWGWASTKPVSNSNTTGSSHSSSSSSSSQSTQHPSGNSQSAATSRISTSQANTSGTITRAKGVEEEEEEEIADPPRAFEEEEEEEDGSEPGTSNATSTSGSHTNHGGRRGKAKADRGHAPEERWINGSNSGRPGTSGSGKRKGAIAAAVAIRKVLTATVSLGEEEEDEGTDSVTQAKSSRNSKAKGHHAPSASEEGEEEGEIKEGDDEESEEKEKAIVKEKKGGRQSRRSPKGSSALNKAKDADTTGDDASHIGGKPRSSASATLANQRIATPVSRRASASVSRTTSRSASLAPPVPSILDDAMQGTTSRAGVSATPQPSESASTPNASATKGELLDVEMGEPQDIEDLKDKQTPNEDLDRSIDKVETGKGSAPAHTPSTGGPKRRNGNGGHKGRRTNNSRDAAEDPIQVEDEAATNEDLDDEAKNTTEGGDDLGLFESESPSPEDDLEDYGEDDFDDAFEDDFEDEAKDRDNNKKGDAPTNGKEQDAEVEVEVQVDGEDEGVDEADNDNEQELQNDNEAEPAIEPEQENEPDQELEVEPENEIEQEGDDGDEVGMDVDNDLQPAHRAEALDVLARLELKYALLREQIYIEKMDFLAWEEGLLNEGTHPEQLHILRELSRRKDKRLELAAKKKEYELSSITRKRKMDEYGTWSWWKLARDELETDMISETNRKRRRLERDRRAAERPQPVRRIPPLPQVQDLPPAPSLRKIIKCLTNSGGDSQNNRHDGPNSSRQGQLRSYPDLSTLSSMDIGQDLDFFNMHRRDSHLRLAPMSLQSSHSQGLHLPFGHHPQQPGYDQYLDVPGGYATIGGSRMPPAGPSSAPQAMGQPQIPFSHHGTPVPQTNPSGYVHFGPNQGPNAPSGSSCLNNPPPPGPPLPQPLPSSLSHSNSNSGPGPLHGPESRHPLLGSSTAEVQQLSLGRNELQEMSVMTGPPHGRESGRDGSFYPPHSQPHNGPGGYPMPGSHPPRMSTSPVGPGPGKQVLGPERPWSGPGGYPVDGRGRDIIMMEAEERERERFIRERREREKEREREREMQDLDLQRIRERETYPPHRLGGSLPPPPAQHPHTQNEASGPSTSHLHHHHRHHHHHVLHHHPQQSPSGGAQSHPAPPVREMDGPRPHSGSSHSLPPPGHPTEVINLSSSKIPSGPPGPSILAGPGSSRSHWKDDNYPPLPPGPHSSEYREGRNKHGSSGGRPSSASSPPGHPPIDDRDRPMATPFVLGPSHAMSAGQPLRQESLNSSPRAGGWNDDYRGLPAGPPLSHHPSSLPPPGPGGYLGSHDTPHGHVLSPTHRYANPPGTSGGPGRSLPPLSSSQPPTPHQNSLGLSPPRNRSVHTPSSPPPASSSSNYPPPNPPLHRSPRYGPLPPPLATRSPQSNLKMSRPPSPPSSLTSKMLSGPLPPGSASTSGSPLAQGPSSMHQGTASAFSSPRLTGPGGPGRATPTGSGLPLPPPLHPQPLLGGPLEIKGPDHIPGIGPGITPYPPPPSKLGLGSRTGSPMIMSSYPSGGPLSPTATRGPMGPGGLGITERDRDRERDSWEKERERDRERDRERPLSPPRSLPPSSSKMSVPQMVDGH